MSRAVCWSRILFALVLPLFAMGAVLVSTPAVDAVGCGPAPQLPSSTVQSQERWRYSYDEAGSYDVVGWSPSEVALMVNGQGCALFRIGLVGVDLFSGHELWRVSSDQWNGSAEKGTTVRGDLVIVPTTKTIYAYDLTTGALRWNLDHGYNDFPNIVANDQQIVIIAFDANLLGLDGLTGQVLWQQTLPAGSISDWEDIQNGPLVGIGRPETAGQDVPVFGIDKSSGAILWQTTVGQTATSTGGTLELAANHSGLVAAEVRTDGSMSLLALDATTGAIRWSIPLSNDNVFARMYVTNGAQPTVVYASGSATEVKTATGYDGATGAQRWQNQNIGADAILADDTHLVGAGPTLSFMNALVSVDGETGQMLWAQPYALLDGSFSGTARILHTQVIFTPAQSESTSPSVMGIDLTSGNVLWANNFPEFDLLSLAGLPAGLVLVNGDTADQAIAVALAP